MEQALNIWADMYNKADRERFNLMLENGKLKQILQEIKDILEQYLDYDKRVDKEADVDVYLMAMQKWLNKVENLK